jgi:hypothetical protein
MIRNVRHGAWQTEPRNLEQETDAHRAGSAVRNREPFVEREDDERPSGPVEVEALPPAAFGDL